MNLNDKTIVITGASDGIGKQIALRLAQEGVQLALLAQDESRLAETCVQAKELGVKNARSYVCDMRDTSLLEKTVRSIIQDFTSVDALVNNAGIWQKLMQIDELAGSAVSEIIETNLTALIQCTRLFLPALRTRDEAAIINVVSKSGIVSQEGQSVYTASKFGARGFTDVLKVDLKGTNIRVAGVYQSGTNTKMFEKAGNTPPVEKFTNPADLADVIVYMLSRPKKIWLHEVHVEY